MTHQMKLKWINYILNTKPTQIYNDWQEYKQKQKKLNKYNSSIRDHHTAIQHALPGIKEKCIHIPSPNCRPHYCENFHNDLYSCKSCPRANQHNLYKSILKKRNEAQQDVSMHWLQKLENVR